MNGSSLEDALAAIDPTRHSVLCRRLLELIEKPTLFASEFDTHFRSASPQVAEDLLAFREATISELSEHFKSNRYREGMSFLLKLACFWYSTLSDDLKDRLLDAKEAIEEHCAKQVKMEGLKQQLLSFQSVIGELNELRLCTTIDAKRLQALCAAALARFKPLSKPKGRPGRPKSVDSELSHTLTELLVIGGFDGSKNSCSKAIAARIAKNVASNYEFVLNDNSLRAYATNTKRVLDKN